MLQPPKLDALKSLLPDQVTAALSVQTPVGGPPPPEKELIAIDSMVPTRRNEFIHGRVCARAALDKLGFPAQAIPVGADRAPIWPEGVVGSISHCGPVAAAATAHRHEFAGLGIDLETDEPLDSATLQLICRPSEQNWLQETDDPLRFAKLIFSAKESIYKSIWPTIRHFVDFKDIGIHLDVDAGGFAPVEWADNLPDWIMQRITGRCLLQDGWIITTTCFIATKP